MFDSHSSPILIEYRPRNRNTYIRIGQNGEVKVRTPLRNESAIRRILKFREGWIRTKLTEIQAYRSDMPIVGKEIRFRGETRSVEQLPNLHKKILKAENILTIEKHYYQFYKEESVLTIPSRVAFYARKMGLCPSDIRFKRLRSRWGSCDTKGVVTFNIMMMQLSYEQIDYIIVHELAHLRHMNHSKHFHELVKEYLPEAARVRKEIKAIRPTL